MPVVLEADLLDKLRKIERLHAGATTPGEKDAAASALARIQARLAEITRTEPAVEFNFRMRDLWSKRLLIALLRRYSIRPYRYSRQRRTTVMARVPRSFVNETLWPEYLELSQVLKTYFSDMTDRVIAQSIHGDATEEEVVPGDYLEQHTV